MIRLAFFTGIFLSLFLRLYFTVNGSQVADIHTLFEMGEITLKGINPYLALNYNVYPPLALYLEIITIKLSQFLNIPFFILIKFWPNLADFAMAGILYLFLKKKNIKQNLIYLWVLIFLLNPVSIIISSAHGQLDSVVTFFVILSIYTLTFNIKRFYLSALFLGIAIAIKANPLILIPFFLTFKKMKLKQVIIFFVISILPTALMLLTFAQDNPKFVLSKMFNYSGANDFGIPALLRGWYFQKTQDYNFFFPQSLINLSKIFFLLGTVVLIFIFRNRERLVKSCLAVYLLFLGFYFGISAQYLSWILPLAILEREFMIIPFLIASTIALLGFYFYINPTIIISQFSFVMPYQSWAMSVYILGNLLLWMVILWWLGKIIFKPSRK